MNAVRVGLMGLGTIGTGVARLMREHEELFAEKIGRRLHLARIADLDIERDRGLDLRGIEMTTDAMRIVEAEDIDVVIELIGGYEPARTFVQRALENGKHVVTANKALIAKHGEELLQLASQQGVLIGFEAAVGGGIPCLKALREGLAANRITWLCGILNGTCNYILTRMEQEGAPFADVLRCAQELGYAEADPSFDIEGTDTAHKLSILAAMAFGCRIRFDDVYVEGITGIAPEDIQSAQDLGYRVKLLGLARTYGDRIEMRVHPALVPVEAPIAQVSGSYNAVLVNGDYVENTLYIGRGAGERPTASAVVADVLDIARYLPDGVRYAPPPMAWKDASRKRLETLPIDEVESEYYLRLMVKDQPGVLASVTQILAHHRISLEAVMQKERHATQAVPVVLLTHRTREGNLKAALDRIVTLPVVEGRPFFLRIARFEENV